MSLRSLIHAAQSAAHHALSPGQGKLQAQLTKLKPEIDQRLRDVHQHLQRWPLPAGLSRDRLPALQEREGQLRRELESIVREGDSPRTSHRWMALAAESQALAQDAGLLPATSAPDLGSEGERVEDATWFERERTSQDKLRSLEARHRPSGHRLFGHQIRRADRIAAEVERQVQQSSMPTRAALDGNLLSANERAGQQLAASLGAHGQVMSAIGHLRERLDTLERRDDAACFAGERREIRARIEESLSIGTAKEGGWHKASGALAAAATWLDRLESDLSRLDARPRSWREMAVDRRDLTSQARAALDQRAFRAARLMGATGCDTRTAMAMARRTEQAIAQGCPETSALVNEQVRHALLKRHPEGIVNPLARMLRMEGTASPDDAMSVLRLMAHLPARMAEQLADAGLTICPSPGSTSNAAPHRLLEARDDHSAGFYSSKDRRLVVKTSRDLDQGPPSIEARTAPLHEAAHAYEHLIASKTHRDPAFVAAHKRDLVEGHIVEGDDDYFRKTSDHVHSNPREESYAESLAMYLLGSRRWPALHAYWSDHLSGRNKS